MEKLRGLLDRVNRFIGGEEVSDEQFEELIGEIELLELEGQGARAKRVAVLASLARLRQLR
jgi:hypothetical protein